MPGYEVIPPVCRFEDAGHYYWLLAKSCLSHAKRESLGKSSSSTAFLHVHRDVWLSWPLSLAPDPNGSTTVVKDQATKFRHYLSQSENYHVYSTVHQFIVSFL